MRLRRSLIAFKSNRKPRIRANRQIRIPEVRVIDEEGEQLGVMATEQALDMAGEKGLDLVEVSPTARPPVCRIMDFGKYKYEQNKKQKESKKKQHTVSVKEVKFRPKTEEHDYQFKKRHALEFLEKGHKVKATLMFRGRELDHKDMGERILRRLAEETAEIAAIEREPKFEGRTMVMYLAPLPKRPVQAKKSEANTDTKEEVTRNAENENEPGSEKTVSADGDR